VWGGEGGGRGKDGDLIGDQSSKIALMQEVCRGGGLHVITGKRQSWTAQSVAIFSDVAKKPRPRGEQNHKTVRGSGTL